VHIYVCIKEIQNPEIASEVFRVNEETKEITPVPGLPLVTSPFDEQALEAALRIRDRLPDTRITAVSFGPKSAHAAIKRALAMGADDGILISDIGLEALDGFATACVLGEAIRKAGKADLVLAGRQAADWDAGIVGCGIGEFLEMPVITFAKSVEADGSRIRVERVLDDGFETVETSMPCVVTISNELGEPRKASLRETMRAAKKPVAMWDAESLGVTRDSFGESHSRQTRERLFIPERGKKCEMFADGAAHEIAKEIVDRLVATRLI
jgi:electron transfer flavoprotein beta subunit